MERMYRRRRCQDVKCVKRLIEAPGLLGVHAGTQWLVSGLCARL